MEKQSELELWIHQNDNNIILSKREKIMEDIHRLRKSSGNHLKLDGKEMQDGGIIIQIILDYKFKQVKEIDKKLGI